MVAHDIHIFSDSAPNRSIVVINFRNEVDANEFTEAYNGKQFNSMEVGHQASGLCMTEVH